MEPLDVLWVGLGGGAGSVLRWLVARITGEQYHGGFPLATFITNVSGAFVIGFLSVYFGIDWRDRYGSFLKAGILTGVLGGYTTFSTMQLDASKLSGQGERTASAMYLLLSVGVGLLAALIGAALANYVV